MTENQKRLRELRDRESRAKQRLAELSQVESLTDEQRAELDKIEADTPDLQRQIRAASASVAADEESAETQVREQGDDPETRERLELRGRCNVGAYFAAAVRGKQLTGAEAELAQAAGIPDGTIPIELWEPQPEARSAEQRELTPAPGTTGINLDTLQPQVFAPSIAAQLMIDMPNVSSGTYASGTITTAATAAAKNKGDAVPATAGAFTVETASPRRIGGSLELAVEDIAAVGAGNFESVLRDHISLVLAAELDDQIINGDGTAPNISGLFNELDNPAAPAADVETFDRFLAIAADQVDGLWASKLMHIAMVVGVDTYRLALKTYRDLSNTDLGEVSFSTFAEKMLAGFWTNSRMPAAASDIQQGLVCRKGRTGLRTAVLPHWGYIAIDDIYTGATKGQRAYTISTLIGSQVILVQPNAYAQVAFRVS